MNEVANAKLVMQESLSPTFVLNDYYTKLFACENNKVTASK